MSNRNKWRKRLKRCFREKNADQLRLVIEKAGEVLGQEETERLMIDDVMPNLTWDEQAWWMDQVPPEARQEMTQMARQAMFSMLIDEGFEMGKDFSVASDGGFMISDRAREHLLSQIPADKRHEIEEQMFSMSQNPYELIEEQLNVPFFDNLQNVAKARLAGLDDVSAIGYMTNIIAGVMNRHPQLTDFPVWFITSTISQERWDRISKIENPDWGDVSCFMADLLIAAGAEKEIDKQPDGEWFMSRKALQILSQIYESENVSLRDVIAACDQQLS